MQNKHTRLQAIRAIISSSPIGKQEELLRELEKAGFPTTQATLSRELKRLHIGKVRTRGGLSVYALPADGPLVTPLSRQEIHNGCWRVQFSGQMMVVHTPPGYASMVASEVDAAKNEAFIGTVAGDDTIFVVLSEEASREEATYEISKILNKLR